MKNFGSVSMCNFNIFRICAYLCGNLYQGDFFQEALVFVPRNLYFFFLWEPFHSKAQWIEIFCDGAFFFLVKWIIMEYHGMIMESLKIGNTMGWKLGTYKSFIAHNHRFDSIAMPEGTCKPPLLQWGTGNVHLLVLVKSKCLSF